MATGCLTNVALLITLYPEVKEMIEEIVIMGGWYVIMSSFFDSSSFLKTC